MTRPRIIHNYAVMSYDHTVWSCYHRAEYADLKILIADSSLLDDFLSGKHNITQSLPATARYLLGLDSSTPLPHTQDSWSRVAMDVFNPQDTLIVLNKVDLLESADGPVPDRFDTKRLHERCGGAEVCTMSCKTGKGVDLFMKSMEDMLRIMYVCSCTQCECS